MDQDLSSLLLSSVAALKCHFLRPAKLLSLQVCQKWLQQSKRVIEDYISKFQLELKSTRRTQETEVWHTGISVDVSLTGSPLRKGQVASESNRIKPCPPPGVWNSLTTSTAQVHTPPLTSHASVNSILPLGLLYQARRRGAFTAYIYALLHSWVAG